MADERSRRIIEEPLCLAGRPFRNQCAVMLRTACSAIHVALAWALSVLSHV